MIEEKMKRARYRGHPILPLIVDEIARSDKINPALQPVLQSLSNQLPVTH